MKKTIVGWNGKTTPVVIKKKVTVAKHFVCGIAKTREIGRMYAKNGYTLSDSKVAGKRWIVWKVL